MRSFDVCVLTWVLMVLSSIAIAKPDSPGEPDRTNTPGGPQFVYEQFRRKVQFEVAEKREAQISGLKRLLALGTSQEEAPDLKFRLAELYSDKSRYFFFSSQEKDDQAGATTKEEQTRLNQEKAADLEESNIWANEALKVYDDIQNSYPDYVRMPEVLFALGQSLWTSGQKKKALGPYAELIRRFPDNPLVAEAWIAFGEFYFDDGDVQKALKSYIKASENKRSRVYGFALYKQAWCYYNMAEWHKALRKFEATVLYSQLSAEMSGENKIALGREAQMDWVRTYVHIGKARDARGEIQRLLDLDRCVDRCLLLLDVLAGLWYDEGYFAESARIYRQIVALDSTSLRNPFRQARVVDLTDRMGDKRQTLHVAKDLVQVFKESRLRFEGLLDGSEEKIQAQDDVIEAQLVAENILKRLAQEWNKEARKTNQAETYRQAQEMYGVYLDVFPKSEFAYIMKFQYADLLYKIERFDAAATAYYEVVKAKPKDGEHLQEAANDNILALDEHLRDIGLELPENLKVARPIHPQHQRLIEAAQRYLQVLSSKKDESSIDQKYGAVKLKVARIYYAYNQFPTAVSMFEEIIEDYPSSEQAVVSANLVVDIYNLQENWEALYDTVRSYRKNTALVKGQPKFQQELSQFGEYAKFALIQKLEKSVEAEQGDLRRVAAGYEEFYREFPKSTNADEAIFNASVIWDRIGEKSRASRLRAHLLKTYRDSPLRADVAYYVAKRHEERTEYKQAASALWGFVKEFPDDKRVRNALYDASIFFAGTGQANRAAALRKKYVEDYGRRRDARKDVVNIAYAEALELDQAKRFRSAATQYSEFTKKYPRDLRVYDVMWREAEIRRRYLRQKTLAEEVEKKLLGTVNWRRSKGIKVPPSGLRYASLVAFRALDEDDREYRKMRLKTPNLRNPQPFQRSIRDKARARDRLIKRYTRVVTKYKQAESSIAALYKIAQSWDVFSEALLKVPCPRGVSRDVCGEVKAQLEQLSRPAQKSAIEAYQACVTESNKSDTFTKYSTRCAKQLEALAPAEQPPLVEQLIAEQKLSLQPIEVTGHALVLGPRSRTIDTPARNPVARGER